LEVDFIPQESEAPVNPDLDAGETAALALAAKLCADLLLMDDRAGVTAGRAAGFNVMGTLSVLDRAARRGLIDLATAFARLRTTSFRCHPEVMEGILSRYEAERRTS